MFPPSTSPPDVNITALSSSVLSLSVMVTAVAIAAVPEVFWFPAVFTPGKFMFPVPSNDTPPIVLADANAVAVAANPLQVADDPLAFPVTFPVIGPLNPVAVNNPLEELKAKLVPDLGPKSPVAAVTNKGKHVVSVLSSATVITVGVGAVPTNEVAVKAPVLELNERLLPDFGAKSPVAAVANNGKHVVSVDSSATVTFVAVVAVAAFPVVLPEVPDVFPVTLPVNAPANPVAVKTPLDELKAKLVPDFGGKSPVAAVTNKGKQVVSDDSSAIVIVVGT